MGLESGVKSSLLLSSVNKHIVWPEVSCHDSECTIDGNFPQIITVILMRTFKLSRHEAIKSYLATRCLHASCVDSYIYEYQPRL